VTIALGWQPGVAWGMTYSRLNWWLAKAVKFRKALSER
jgi:hypothetical protein